VLVRTDATADSAIREEDNHLSANQQLSQRAWLWSHVLDTLHLSSTRDLFQHAFPGWPLELRVGFCRRWHPGTLRPNGLA